MSKISQSTRVSRADLLRCLFAGGADELDGTADALGFNRVKKRRDDPEPRAKQIAQPINQKPDIVSDEEQPELPPVNQEKMHYYRITKRERLKSEEDANKSSDYPDWYTKSQETLLDTGSNSWVPQQQPLKFQSLVPWSRLWPFLHEVLSNLCQSQEPDVEQVVRDIASGKLIGQIPVKQRKTWAGTAKLLIDINTATFPLRTDFIYLRDNLLKLRGDYGLQVHYLQDKPGGEIYYWDNGVERVQDWRMPKADMPLLILSDLGLLSPSKRTLNQWLVFGFQLATHGCRPVVLMPVPTRMIDTRLLKYFDCVSWDRGTERLKPLLNARPDTAKPEEHRRKTRELLTHLSPAVRVNSSLIRATRYQSMSEQMDVGHEAAAWQHPAVQAYGDDFVWKASDHEQLLQAFCDLSEEQQAVMVDFIARYHATLPDVLFFESMQNCLQLNASAVDSGIQYATQRYLAALVRTYNDYPERRALGQWVDRYDVRHQASSLKRNNEILGALKGINLKRSTKVGQDIPLPKGINRDLMEPFVTNTRQAMRYELRQQGRNLLFALEGFAEVGNDGFGVQSSLITTAEASLDFLVKRTRTIDGLKASHLMRFAPDQTVTIALAGSRSYELETGRERITIEPLSKPKWAVSIGQNTEGLYAKSVDKDQNGRFWYWHYPDTVEPFKIWVTNGNDDRSNELIEKLKKLAGVRVIGDMATLKHGDSISKFMESLYEAVWDADFKLVLINKKSAMDDLTEFYKFQKIIPALTEDIPVDRLPHGVKEMQLTSIHSEDGMRQLIELVEQKALESQIARGFWYSEGSKQLTAPDWSEEAGIDQFGLYADADICGVRQRFRWIEPTTFQMGSPETEEGRGSNETQHQVTLSQGYWLADTACTQRLWQAVMVDNPSRFKGETNPVEQLSWDDIQSFLQLINRKQTKLYLRLPTEAEWENACRAGTKTPFHFGGKDDLNVYEANYSGKWEEYDINGKTKPVKSYPPNQWGLYEMHGNVFERCEDWYDNYSIGSSVDPIETSRGEARVLRGGSWVEYGSHIRSAFRYKGRSDGRNHYIGFRLARSHGQPSTRSVQVGQEQVGSLVIDEQEYSTLLARRDKILD